MSEIGSNNGWLEAAIAWEVCASLHRQYCKGKDGLFTTRQSDFVKHAENARRLASRGQTPAGAAQAAPRNGALATPAQPVTWPRNAAEVREFMDAHCQREERANDDSSPSDDDLYALTADNFLSAVNSWAAEQPAQKGCSND